MLDVAGEKGTAGDLLLHDMGQGLPFRHGVFDGAIRSPMLSSPPMWHVGKCVVMCTYRVWQYLGLAVALLLTQEMQCAKVN